jgi:hypothetical protein
VSSKRDDYISRQSEAIAGEFGTANMDELFGSHAQTERKHRLDGIQDQIDRFEVEVLSPEELADSDPMMGDPEFLGPGPTDKRMLPVNILRRREKAERLRADAEAQPYEPAPRERVHEQKRTEADDVGDRMWGEFTTKYPALANDQAAAVQVAEALAKSGKQFATMDEFYDAVADELGDDDGRTTGLGNGRPAAAAPRGQPATERTSRDAVTEQHQDQSKGWQH